MVINLDKHKTFFPNYSPFLHLTKETRSESIFLRLIVMSDRSKLDLEKTRGQTGSEEVDLDSSV